jgi:iron complex transport system substrate-binding protein
MRACLPTLLVLCGACAEPAAPGPGRVSRPMRVLPANSAATDLLIEVCPRERIVAIPDAARHWSMIADDLGHWAEKPVLARFTGEAVLALEPDLVIASTWSDRAPIEVLRSAGIRVVELPDAESWADLVASVELLGEELDERERAAAFCERLEARREALALLAQPRRRILPYANFGQGGSTSGSNTTLDLAIRLAGFENVAASADLKRHASISLEEVILLDPEVFLTASGRDGVASGASYLRGEPALAHLLAVKDDRIVVLPAELFSASSHRVLDAAEALAARVEVLFDE